MPGGVDRLDAFPLIPRQGHLQQNLAESEHAIHRGADLVAHRREEFALRTTGRFGGVLRLLQFPENPATFSGFIRNDQQQGLAVDAGQSSARGQQPSAASLSIDRKLLDRIDCRRASENQSIAFASGGETGCETADQRVRPDTHEIRACLIDENVLLLGIHHRDHRRHLVEHRSVEFFGAAQHATARFYGIERFVEFERERPQLGSRGQRYPVRVDAVRAALQDVLDQVDRLDHVMPEQQHDHRDGGQQEQAPREEVQPGAANDLCVARRLIQSDGNHAAAQCLAGLIGGRQKHR